MKHQLPPLVLAALFSTLSCAGPSATPGLLAGPADAQTIREEFDPRSLAEDLLLIRPTFTRQNLQEAPAAPPVPAPADDDAPTADLPVVESTPADVFRLQLVTLSNEAKAIELQSTLSAALEVPIYIVPRGQHYLLQAGQYETHSAATQLKERATTLSSDYADAFVVSTTAAAPLPADPSAPSSAATAPPPHDEADSATPADLVRAFGWRVLIDQFLSHDEADRLKRRAQKRLRRDDIDVTFKAPWYKVEVGHYRTEAEAQTVAEKIERYYPNALTVRSQILVPRED